MFTVHAPAKINWFLHVLVKRGDGFHDIQSIMQCVGLYDEISFEDSDRIEVMTETPIPADFNLVTKAAYLLKDFSGFKRGAEITLKKNIPIAAGLGGGSSDAANTLKGLNTLWGLNLNNLEFLELAEKLGSDVPFFIDSAPAFVEGRGERIAPVEISVGYGILLIKPSFGVSSGWAYSEIRDYSRPVDSRFVLNLIEQGDFVSLRKAVKNDLEAPVIKKHPEIADIKKTLRESGALYSLMSGSGSTVFGVFADKQEAEEARKSFDGCWSYAADLLAR